MRTVRSLPQSGVSLAETPSPRTETPSPLGTDPLPLWTETLPLWTDICENITFANFAVGNNKHTMMWL